MSDIQIEDAKAQLREVAKSQRAALGGAERAEAARAAAQHFLDGVPLSTSQTIALYWPIRDEIDCKPVLSHLMDNGYRVCLPVIIGDEEPLEFRIWAPGAALYESGFGTLAPADGSEVVEPDLVVVPLLGFDNSGTRLGYGKGHYDRSLAAMSTMPKLVGYAFAAQELTDIPAGAHDVPLNYLVTENGLRKFS